MDARRRVVLVLGGLFLGLLGLAVFSIGSSGDYNVAAPVGGNNAGPGIQALVHGSVTGYLSHQPIVGLTSILLRLPLVALASALGAGRLMTYQVGALACLLPLALGGAWLVSEPDLSSRQRLLRLAAVLLVIQSPIIHNGLTAGHPEGVLSTLLATTAVLAAMRGEARWAAVLLGLSISAKETGVIGVVPVMLALPGRRREVAAITGGLVLLLCGTVWLADPSALIRSVHGEGATRYLTPFSLLWPLSAPLHIGTHLSVARVMPLGLTRTPATLLTIACALPLGCWWFARTWRRGATAHPLVMLVLFGLLRCVLDSTHEAYYWVSLLIPMAAWEAWENRIPVRTLLISSTVFVLFSTLGRIAPTYVYMLSVGGEALLVVYLAQRAIERPSPAAHRWSMADPRLALAVSPDGR